MTITDIYRDRVKQLTNILDKVELYMLAHESGDVTADNLRYSAMAQEVKKYYQGANN